jgi:hypothetical protein
MAETALDKIQGYENKIKTELDGLKKDLEKALNDALISFDTIKKYDPSYDVTGLLKPFYKNIPMPIVTTGGKRSEKITVTIDNVLKKNGRMSEADIIKALPTISKSKIQSALNKIKAKKESGIRDSFFFVDGLFISKSEKI